MNDETKYILWVEPIDRPAHPTWLRRRLPKHRGRHLRMYGDAITNGHAYRLPPTDDGRQRRLEVIEP
jgi:hypothetical protein